MHIIRLVALIALAALSNVLPTNAKTIDEDKLYALMSANRCLDARHAVETATNSNDVLKKPFGGALYGASICCSPTKYIAPSDLDNAENYLSDGKGKIGSAVDKWIDKQLKACDERRSDLLQNLPSTAALQKASDIKNRMVSELSGKIMGHCKMQNLASALVRSHHEKTTLYRIVPQSDGKVRPPEPLLRAVKTSYVEGVPEIAVCPPFFAVSSSQQPAAICNAAHRFLDFFTSRYAARQPEAWVGLVHYGSSKALYAHANRTGKPIHCEGVLGYFDWPRQIVIWSAPAGWFGTFDHELTHALTYWDAPLLPRWFQEGFAGLYENAKLDANGYYIGIENPWRQDTLRRNGITQVRAREFMNVIMMHPTDFESKAVHSSIAREALRQIQNCGDLPGLYRDMREESRHPQSLSKDGSGHIARTQDMRRSAWKRIIKRHVRDMPCR